MSSLPSRSIGNWTTELLAPDGLFKSEIFSLSFLTFSSDKEPSRGVLPERQGGIGHFALHSFWGGLETLSPKGLLCLSLFWPNSNLSSVPLFWYCDFQNGSLFCFCCPSLVRDSADKLLCLSLLHRKSFSSWEILKQ